MCLSVSQCTESLWKHGVPCVVGRRGRHRLNQWRNARKLQTPGKFHRPYQKVHIEESRWYRRGWGWVETKHLSRIVRGLLKRRGDHAVKAATAWWAWMGKLSGRGTRGRAGGRGSSRARLSAALHRRHEGGDATSIEHRRLSLRGIKTVAVLVSINYCSWTDLISQSSNSSDKTALYLENFLWHSFQHRENYIPWWMQC